LGTLLCTHIAYLVVSNGNAVNLMASAPARLPDTSPVPSYIHVTLFLS